MASKLNKNDIKYLTSKIQTEGFDYCFIDYSDWEEIEGKEFQEKLKVFKDARESFIVFLKSQGVKIEDD